MASKQSHDELEALWVDNYSILVNQARRKMPNGYEAEDVVQDGFLKILERTDEIKVDQTFAYLAAVIRHGTIHRLRRKMAHERYTLKSIAELKSYQHPDAGERIEKLERVRMMKEAMSTLPESQRRVLEMRAHGMKPREIAQAESEAGRTTTANQVSCQINRARKSVKAYLIDRGFAPALLPLRPLTHLRAKLGFLRSRANQLQPGDFLKWGESVLVALTMTGLLFSSLGASATEPRVQTMSKSSTRNAPSTLTVVSDRVEQLPLLRTISSGKSQTPPPPSVNAPEIYWYGASVSVPSGLPPAVGNTLTASVVVNCGSDPSHRGPVTSVICPVLGEPTSLGTP